MALTQISTAGVKDDAVTAGKIPANAVGSSELADNAVDTAAIADDAVTGAKLASNAVVTDSIVAANITTAKIANDAVTENQLASNAVVTASIQDSNVTTAKIADQAVTLAKLPHGDSNNNGKFLRANNGADPTFETVSTDLVADTSPQLGGDLYANGNQIYIEDSTGSNHNRLKFGNSSDLQIYHDNNSKIHGSSGYTQLSAQNGSVYIDGNSIFLRSGDGSETYAKFVDDGKVELRFNDSIKFETTSYGTKITGVQSTTSSVRFSVRSSLNDVGFGTTHGSGITTYDVSYLSPIPIFSTRSVGVDTHSGLSFGSYASGEYLKYTVPYDGVYCFESLIGFALHDSDDWFAVGMMVNTTNNASSGDIPYNQMMLQFVRDGVDSGNGQHGAVLMELSANDYVVFFQQSSASVKCRGNTHVVRGTLVN